MTLDTKIDTDVDKSSRGPSRGVWVTLLALMASAAVLASSDPVADPKLKSMPMGFDKAYMKVIATPDYALLEQGEIQYQEKQTSSDTILAQTMGLIKASPEACFKAVRQYDAYTKTMPYTVESRVLRRYPLEGTNSPGSEAVDFWTRVSVFGFETRYLLRIAHLEEASAHRYRSFWTLVDRPDQLPCVDSEKRPCENDLAANVGSHIFEPYKGDPKRTLHTYTLKLVGKSWFQRTALNIGGGTSMRKVTEQTRKAAEGK